MPMAAIIEDDKIKVINGTNCDVKYCVEMGCDFPQCASLTGEEFDDLECARNKYPDISIIYPGGLTL